MPRLRLRRGAEERTRRRFARRQWARRWGVWRWVAAAVVLLGLAGTGVWLVLFSQALAVHEVAVTGADYLDPSEVTAAARVPIDRPLATVDLGLIQRRVESIAAVRSAEVTRRWPHTVLIEVTERTPVAVVDVAGTLRAMDVDGVFFRDYPTRPHDLPLAEIPANADGDTRREAAGVLAALPGELLHRVDHLQAESIDQIRLVLRDGRVVVWGSAEQSAEKAKVLDDLLVFDARQYDVSVPSRPATH